MPTGYRVEGRIVHLELIGEYTPQDIKDTVERALAARDLPQDPLLLMDLMQSRSLGERTPQDLRDMATYLAGVSDRFGARLGIAAGSNLHYGMMRMAEVYSASGGMTARVFRSVPEAAAWLQQEPA